MPLTNIGYHQQKRKEVTVEKEMPVEEQAVGTKETAELWHVIRTEKQFS